MSLRQKLGLQLGFAVLLTVFIDSAIYLSISTRVVHNEFEARQQSVADNMAQLLETNWRDQNFTSMVKLIDSLKMQGDFAAIWLCDTKGTIIISDQAAHTGKKLYEVGIPDRHVAIAGLGSLAMQSNTGRSSQFFWGLLWRGTLATLAALVVILAFVHRRYQSTIDAMDETVNAAERLGQGDFSISLPGHTTIELDRLHQSLNQASAHLQTLTEDLTCQMQQAQAASQTKGMFLANMSHELRTPLNGILGTAELLNQSRLDTDQRSYLSTMRRSAQDLVAIVNDILDFSRIEAGKLELIPEPCDLATSMEDVVELLAPLAEEKNLPLTIHIQPYHTPWIIADIGRLRQIATNLVGNAIKFTDKGQIAVNLDIQQEQDQQQVTIRLIVTDTGVGIAPEKLQAIFDSFTQAENGPSRNHGGTGLGLAICQRLAHMMHGNITVDSTLGHGSTFCFESHFPLAKIHAHQLMRAIPAMAQP